MQVGTERKNLKCCAFDFCLDACLPEAHTALGKQFQQHALKDNVFWLLQRAGSVHSVFKCTVEAPEEGRKNNMCPQLWIDNKQNARVIKKRSPTSALTSLYIKGMLNNVTLSAVSFSFLV